MRKQGQAFLSDSHLSTLANFPPFKHMTSFLFVERYFPGVKHHTGSERLTTWERHGFITSQLFYPKADTDPRGGKKTKSLYFTDRNLAVLRDYLYAHQQGDRYDRDFVHLPTISSEEKSYSNSHLLHETTLAAICHHLERSSKAAQHWQVLAWEITSPRSKEIPHKNVTFRARIGDKRIEHAQHFNPDIVAFLADTTKPAKSALTFQVIEYDNNTHSPEAFRDKLEAFMAYQRDGHFPELITQMATKYGLHIPDPAAVEIFYLIITADPKSDHFRRNDLLMTSNRYKWYTQFLFASITDCATKNMFVDPIWLRLKEYEKHALPVIQKTIPKSAGLRIQTQRRHEILNNPTHMPRVALAD